MAINGSNLKVDPESPGALGGLQNRGDHRTRSEKTPGGGHCHDRRETDTVISSQCWHASSITGHRYEPLRYCEDMNCARNSHRVHLATCAFDINRARIN